MLVVLNLVGGFEALGTLLAVGLMMLPAAAARFWTHGGSSRCACSRSASGSCRTSFGLLVSYHLSVASGPAIILTAGAIYCVSLLFGSRGLVAGRFATRHRIA